MQFLNSYSGYFLLIGLIILGLRFYCRWSKTIHQPAPGEKELTPPLAELKQRPTAPLVSLLVAAWNEEAGIEGFLKSFQGLDYPHKELILIAGGSDNTFARATRWTSPRITVLEQHQGEGKYRSLQRGLKFVRGSIVHLTDADCLLDSESFRRLLDPLITGGEQAVVGRIRPPAHQLGNAFVRAQWGMRQFGGISSNPNRYVTSLLGNNSAVARSLLEICLAAPANQPVGEDHYFALRIKQAGHRIYAVHESCVATEFPQSIGDYIRQRSRWRRGWLILNYQFGDRRWRRDLLMVLKSQMLLVVLPLLSWSFGPVFGVVWLLGWVYYATPYLLVTLWMERSRAEASAEKSPKEKDGIAFIVFCQLMIAELCAQAMVLPQLLNAKWRSAW